MLKIAQDLGMVALAALLFGGIASVRLVRQLALTRTGKKIILPPSNTIASWLMIGAAAISAVAAVLAAGSLFFPAA